MFDFFTSTRRPQKGTPVLAAAKVREQLLGVNRPSSPWQLAADPSGKADFIAEWKIVDARWYEIFAKASLTKVFKIHLRLDEKKHEVRAMDEEYEVEWRAGVPSLSLSVSKFKGQTQSVEFGAAYAFTEELAPGQVYKYRFNSGEIKKPLQDAVTACGWTYQGVAFGKL